MKHIIKYFLLSAICVGIVGYIIGSFLTGTNSYIEWSKEGKAIGCFFWLCFTIVITIILSSIKLGSDEN